MVPWVALATVPRPLGQQNTLEPLFSGPNRGITASIIGHGPRPTDSLWRPSAAWTIILKEFEKDPIKSTSKTHINQLEKPHSKTDRQTPQKTQNQPNSRQCQLLTSRLLLTLLALTRCRHEARQGKASSRYRSGCSLRWSQSHCAGLFPQRLLSNASCWTH